MHGQILVLIYNSVLNSPIRRNTTTLNMDSKVGITTPNITPNFGTADREASLLECSPTPLVTSPKMGAELVARRYCSKGVLSAILSGLVIEHCTIHFDEAPLNNLLYSEFSWSKWLIV